MLVTFIEAMTKEKFGAESMNNFFKSCRRCLNSWVVGLIVSVVIGLLIFVPTAGAASLIVVLPLIGCTVMCGAMAFMMRSKKGH